MSFRAILVSRKGAAQRADLVDLEEKDLMVGDVDIDVESSSHPDFRRGDKVIVNG